MIDPGQPRLSIVRQCELVDQPLVNLPRVLPTSPQAQAVSIDDNPKGNGSAPHGLNS